MRKKSIRLVQIMNGERISVLVKKKDNNEKMSSKYPQDEISVSEHIVHVQRYTNEAHTDMQTD